MGKILLLVAIPLVFLLSACGGSVGQQQGGSAQDATGPGTATQQTASPGTTTGDAVATTTAPQAGSRAGVIEPSALLSQEDAEDILGKTVDTVETQEQEKVGLKLVLYHAGTDLLQVAITQQAALPRSRNDSGGLTGAIVDTSAMRWRCEGIGGRGLFATPGYISWWTIITCWSPSVI